jgi:hypothetical protein
MGEINSTLLPRGAPDRKGDAMTRLHAIAKGYARPVARGYLPLEHAHAGLIADTLGAERRGELAPYLASDVFAGLRHTLKLWLAIEEDRRAVAELHIRQRLRPLIAVRKPRNVLLAEAHGINGEEGFPFSEPEVTDVAAEQVWSSLPVAGRRHG